MDWIDRVAKNTENGSVEDVESARVTGGRTSKNFGCLGGVTVGRGTNGEVTGDGSMVFTECQSVLCYSND